MQQRLGLATVWWPMLILSCDHAPRSPYGGGGGGGEHKCCRSEHQLAAHLLVTHPLPLPMHTHPP